MTDLLKTDSTPADPGTSDGGLRASASSQTLESVVTECDLPDAPEKVWKALTVPELLARWLPDAIEGEILSSEPNRLLSCRWPGGERDRDEAGRPLESVVTFELTATPTGGTHLRVIHRLLDSAVAVGRPEGAEGTSVIPFALGPRRGEPVALLRWAA